MFIKRKDLYPVLLVLLVVATVYLYMNKERFIVEHLTSNAPTELPLPSYLKKSEPTGPIKNPERIDPRDIPTGFSEETSYLLSPETVSKMYKPEDRMKMKPKTTSMKDKDPKVEILEAKIDVLMKEIEELKKQQVSK